MTQRDQQLNDSRGRAQAPGAGALDALVLLALVVGIAYASGIRSADRAYSSDLSHRLQTEAMLRGTLALQPLPYGQHADWAWGRGSQQVWGLGVALVRLPFEIGGKFLGAVGFPDRLTFVLLYAAVLVTWWRALGGNGPPSARDRMTRLALVLAFGAVPAFVALCRTRFSAYEEPAAYGYLCAWLQLAGLAGASGDAARRGRWLIVAAAAAGFGVLIRPTLLLAGVVTMAIALTFRTSWRIAAGAAAAFAAGPSIALATNLRRFGDAFEFGQRLNVSRYTLDQLAKNFDAPFWHEPIGSATRELLAALFAMDHRWNGFDVYAGSIHPWFSATERFREFYFTTFGPGSAACVAAAVVLSLSRRPTFARVLARWSVLSFAALFVFYVRMPSMTSRYVMDFAPAIAAAGAAVIVALSDRWPRHAGLVAVAAAVLIAAGVEAGGVDSTHAARPLLREADVANQLREPAAAEPALPRGYSCGDDPAATRILFNGVGWNASGDCRVDAGSTFYLPSGSCIDLDVIATAEPSDVIRLKVGLREWPRTNAGGGPGRVTFCRPAAAPVNPDGIEIVSIAWTDPLHPRSGRYTLSRIAVRN